MLPFWFVRLQRIALRSRFSALVALCAGLILAGSAQAENNAPSGGELSLRGPVDTSFIAELPAPFASTARILTITAGAANSSVLVHFVETTAPNTPLYSTIRLRRDGSLDQAFHAVAQPFDNAVLAVMPDGQAITSRPPYRLAIDGSEYPLAAAASVQSIYYPEEQVLFTDESSASRVRRQILNRAGIGLCGKVALENGMK